MLFIEFPLKLKFGEQNIVKYRNIDDDIWYYMYMDIETIHKLIQNFGVVSMRKMPAQFTNADSPTTGTTINVTYCGAKVQLDCSSGFQKLYAHALQNIEQVW